MKLLFLFQTLLFSFASIAQTDNKYEDLSLGYSFQFDNDWEINKLGNQGTIFSAVNKKKNEMLTLYISQSAINKDYIKNITNADIQAYTQGMKQKVKTEGATLKSIKVIKSIFNNIPCLSTTMHIENQDFLNGIPLFHKQIQFVFNGTKYFIIDYYMPESIFTQYEINLIEQSFHKLRS